jgi:hypothetical protein
VAETKTGMTAEELIAMPDDAMRHEVVPGFERAVKEIFE